MMESMNSWEVGDLRRPLSRGMFRHIEVDNSPSVMGQHEENGPHFECRRGHDKKVDRDKLFQVLVEKPFLLPKRYRSRLNEEQCTSPIRP